VVDPPDNPTGITRRKESGQRLAAPELGSMCLPVSSEVRMPAGWGQHALILASDPLVAWCSRGALFQVMDLGGKGQGQACLGGDILGQLRVLNRTRHSPAPVCASSRRHDRATPAGEAGHQVASSILSAACAASGDSANPPPRRGRSTDAD
jgi:hypothetical protein